MTLCYITVLGGGLVYFLNCAVCQQGSPAMQIDSLSDSVHQLQDCADIFTSNISRIWVTFLVVDVNINSVFLANHTHILLNIMKERKKGFFYQLPSVDIHFHDVKIDPVNCWAD